MNMRAFPYGPGIDVTGPVTSQYAEILTPEAMALAAKLQRAFGGRRAELLALRAKRQAEFDAGALPDFLPRRAPSAKATGRVPRFRPTSSTAASRSPDRSIARWSSTRSTRAPTCSWPTSRDANTPKWDNHLQGQLNLRDAIRRRIDYTSSEGKAYRLNDKTAVLFVRPRGWHLPEKHVLIDGQPISGSIFDFALYFFHNCEGADARGTGPYFYLPKLESHSKRGCGTTCSCSPRTSSGVPRGTIRATVLIETLLAAFEMDEILYELRAHSAGLNCGRWDYIFSCIKKLRHNADFCLADRALVTMTTHFMKSYALLLVKTCHRPERARDGRAWPAQIPVKNDEAANAEAFAKVKGRQGARSRRRARRHVGCATRPRRRRERGIRPADARRRTRSRAGSART
jgi:malate synthase